MDSASREGLWPLIWTFASILVLQNGLIGTCAQSTTGDASAGGKCSGQLWCMKTSSNQSLSATYYYYIPSSRNCEAVPAATCVQPYSNCSFTSREDCQNTCHHVGGCESTPYGCCSEEGTARAEDGTCPDESEANSGGQSSGGVRWDLVATGICGTALILGAVVIIGIVTYIHKHRNRQRHRRYIQQVLNMYDSTDSTDSSDSCIDDNPESNNLFDRL